MTETENPFVAALRKLRHDAGNPTVRVIEEWTLDRVSHSTIAATLNGSVKPRWHTAEVIIEALRGTPGDYYDLWEGSYRRPRPESQSPARVPSNDPTNDVNRTSSKGTTTTPDLLAAILNELQLIRLHLEQRHPQE